MRLAQIIPQGSTRPRPRTVWLLLLGLLLQGLLPIQGHAAKFAEHEIKAVFLFNFASFVRWPEDAFAGPAAPFQYCALEEEGPVVRSLAQILVGETVRGRKILLNSSPGMNVIRDCHILFIGQNSALRIDDIFSAISGSHVLTVSDMKNFAQQGGAVELTRRKERIKLLINTDQLDSAGLKASSKLLRLAEQISHSPGR